MGWLGYTEQQTLDTALPALEMAHAGRIKMLGAIFGSSEAEATTPMPAEAVMGQMRAIFGGKQ